MVFEIGWSFSGFKPENALPIGDGSLIPVAIRPGGAGRAPRKRTVAPVMGTPGKLLCCKGEIGLDRPTAPIALVPQHGGCDSAKCDSRNRMMGVFGTQESLGPCPDFHHFAGVSVQCSGKMAWHIIWGLGGLQNCIAKLSARVGIRRPMGCETINRDRQKTHRDTI